MQKSRFVHKILTLLAIFGLLSVQPLAALSAADIQVIKISPQDKKAVVRIAKGDMQVIAVGDDLAKLGKVTEIAPDRIVIETRGDSGSELVIIRIRQGKQSIERIRRAADKSPGLYRPQPAKNTD